MMKSDERIVIEVHGRETVAKRYDNGKCVARGSTVCSTEDAFDERTGINIAIDRMFENDKSEHKKCLRIDDIKNGDIVFVHDGLYDEPISKIGIVVSDKVMYVYRSRGFDKLKTFFDDNGNAHKGPYRISKVCRGDSIEIAVDHKKDVIYEE